MQIPPQISFENMQPSDAVRAEIRRGVERLEKYRHHVTVAPRTKHRHGSIYCINVWVTIPPKRTFTPLREEIKFWFKEKRTPRNRLDGTNGLGERSRPED
jgi:hypothetical protein